MIKFLTHGCKNTKSLLKLRRPLHCTYLFPTLRSLSPHSTITNSHTIFSPVPSCWMLVAGCPVPTDVFSHVRTQCQKCSISMTWKNPGHLGCRIRKTLTVPAKSERNVSQNYVHKIHSFIILNLTLVYRYGSRNDGDNI
jgi:hypothetical protein